MTKPKAKYRMTGDAFDDLQKLDELEKALKTMTGHYNEYRDLVWTRVKLAYYLDANKKYKVDLERRQIEEV